MGIFFELGCTLVLEFVGFPARYGAAQLGRGYDSRGDLLP